MLHERVSGDAEVGIKVTKGNGNRVWSLDDEQQCGKHGHLVMVNLTRAKGIVISPSGPKAEG